MNSAPLSMNFWPEVFTKPVVAGGEAELVAEVDVEEDLVDVEEVVVVDLLEVVLAVVDAVAPGMHCE